MSEPTHWTITLEEADDGSGDLVLPLTDEIMASAGWKTGDTLIWTDLHNGSWSLKKKDADYKKLIKEEVEEFWEAELEGTMYEHHKEQCMNTISLNRREMEKLWELFNTLQPDKSWGSVTLAQQGNSGIGTVLTATFVVQHREVDGEFTVTISDESNW
jgi:hypothetical protein